MEKIITNPVLIEWVDSHYQVGWSEDFPEPEPLKCRSVGWIMAESKDAVVVASSRAPGQHCGVMTIPQCTVTSVRELK